MRQNENSSIVVTGIGLVTPLGCSRERTWQYVKDGQSVEGVRNAEDFGDEFNPFVRTAPFVNTNGTHRIYPVTLTAVHEALADAVIDLSSMPSDRIGCSVSVSKPIVHSLPSRPLAPDSVSRYLLDKLKIAGPSSNLVAACATGVHSILAGFRWLKEDLCDIAIVGSGESSLNPLLISGFKNMGVLSGFPCPFDKRRNGFVMAEGAGALILEKRTSALARGAKIYAQLVGCAAGSDSSQPTRFAQDGSSIASVLKRVLNESKISPEQVDYVNLHGTGTKLNDALETRAVKSAFRKRAYELSMSSTKSSTGHLLGAAGSVEAGISCLALRDQFVPPTVNLEFPDPECDLDMTPRKGRSKKLQVAMSLSFGFGGPIGAVIFKKP